MTTTCEAPRCDGVPSEMVVARDVTDRYPGVAVDDDGALRLLLCAGCAAQLIDTLAGVDRLSLLTYPVG